MTLTWTRTAALAALGTALTAVAAPPAHARPRQVQCVEGYQFYNEKPQRLQKTWSGMARNEGGDVDKYRLTVTESGKVETKISKSVTAKVEGGFPVFKASLEGQYGREVAKSTTATRGQTYTVKVQPRRQVRVRYGVWTRRYQGLVLSKTNPHPGEPPRLWPVFPPPNCGLYVVADFTTTVATPERGFQKSKPRRITD